MTTARKLGWVLGTLLLCGQAQADEITLAVAGGFKPPMEEIARQFEKQTGHHLLIAYGAVGNLYAQIQHGAPFDALLSADTLVPAKLEQAGQGVTGSRFTYATSQLALWSAKPGLVDAEGRVLKGGKFAHLAIPNPKVGVHGAAAVEVLRKLGLLAQLTPKFVEGENVLQTFQQIQSGNAELGFVSLSLIYHDGQYAKGSHWLVPDELHSPLAQQAILLKPGADKPAARALLGYLKTEPARQAMTAYGYQF